MILNRYFIILIHLLIISIHAMDFPYTPIFKKVKEIPENENNRRILIGLLENDEYIKCIYFENGQTYCTLYGSNNDFSLPIMVLADPRWAHALAEYWVKQRNNQ